MAVQIRKAPPNERTLTWWDRLYFPAILSGLGYTLRKMFQKRFTVQYPEEKIELGPEFRGRPVLVAENGKERCVACGLCARVCPPLAIHMQAAETDDPKERYPAVFEINMLRCIYCGLCEEVCPEEAIVMSGEYDFVFRAREDAIYTKERLLVEKDKLASRLKWLDTMRNPQFGKRYAFRIENNIHSVKGRTMHAEGQEVVP
ncbi:MAG: NADH-quinone oxidoreductase subunit NuoI [Bacteroidia bacterium]|nr:NADH-quinone oxidoreductase subunit NuoI [Bacteroidia bacterium]MDW8236528.1 NADH-quinone oxidoreductase subunit NuoI [Bacteroidia bacterium]